MSQPTLEAWLEDSQENSHRTKMMKKVKKYEATDGEYYEVRDAIGLKCYKKLSPHFNFKMSVNLEGLE